jgi:small subunit ribosomal protein S15
MSQIDKKAIQKQYQRHETDTGSSDVQVAVLTKRIEALTEHLKKHKKDHSSRFGLIKMVNSRRRLLDYLKQKDAERYKRLIEDLSIRR